MVVALLISLTLPIALGTLQGFQEQTQVRAGMRIAQEIGLAATSAYASGEGNVRMVKLDWPDVQQGAALKLRLAGPVGSLLSTRLDVIVSGAVSGQYFLSDPQVHLVSGDEERLEISPGCEGLRLSCVVEADRMWVQVEVVWLLEFILSKTILIVFSLAVLIVSGSMISSFYSEQERDETRNAFQRIVSVVDQGIASGTEFLIRLQMSDYLDTESVLQIGNGSMILSHRERSYSTSLPDNGRLVLLDVAGSERTTIEVGHDDVLVIERAWTDDALQTSIYIENVDATFSTALMNRSTSSKVL
jgi:hypothetical protein